ncbi:MAG: hypothetical protein HRT43_11050 [Campylobacteraceae bacterium]|nr:hypothetical protein [Campylobacteraceae bacterium]
MSLILFPPSFYFLEYFPTLDLEIILVIILSSIFQAIYFFGVANSYSHGNLSLSYPLLRSIPILLVLIYVFFIGDIQSISKEAIAGSLLIIVGCVLLPGKHLKDFKLKNYVNKMFLFVFVAAFGTAGYSVVDSIGMKYLSSISSTTDMTMIAFTYIYIQVFFTSILLGFICLSIAEYRKDLLHVIRFQKLRSLTINSMMMLAYAPILVAMTLVSNISYVVAFRQASIPIAFILGLWVLKESSYMIRWIAVLIILVGLVISALY